MAKNPDDRRIGDRVRTGLAGDFLLDESQIAVEVTDRVVTLVGTVASRAEKALAESAARSVDDVHDIVNAIDVKPMGELRPSDDELQTIVEQVLTWDTLVPERNITVSVADGLVALSGTCPTRSQAREAERAVSHLAGVRDVLNRIETAPRRPAPADVRQVISRALHERAVHQAAHLDVVVDGTTVTVSGTLSSTGERRAVLGAVGHAAGVTKVRDELTVKD